MKSGPVTKSGQKVAPKGKLIKSGIKKESFKWNTPADEFADDVTSDAEDDEGQFMKGNGGETKPFSAEIDGEQYEAHRTDDGQIVIHLGVEEAGKFNVGKSEDSETNEDIQTFLNNFKEEKKPSSDEKKKVKQKYQCPKCPKIWNWPWELRRHVLTHYKEVNCLNDLITIYTVSKDNFLSKFCYFTSRD